MKNFTLLLAAIFCLLSNGFSQSANPNDPNPYQYVFIDAGLNHTVALRCNGTVNTWGDNASGQLGNNNDPNDSDVPVVVTGPTGTDSLTSVVAVAAGDNHTLALLANGTVATWGNNSNGQLGNGTTTDSPYPVFVEDVGGGGTLSNAVAIAAGQRHSLAILDDGTAVAWGYNNNGELADGTTTSRNYPVLMTGIDAGTEPIAIAAGNKHSYVLQDDGRVKSCGADDDGQLGDNGNSGAGAFTSLLYVNTDNSGTIPLENIIAIASGPIHGLALDANGSLWSWGLSGNSINALGRNASTPEQKFAGQVDDISTAIAISAGENTSFAMLEDSTVWTFGDDDSGQLGIGAGDESTITPTQIPSLFNIKAIEGGGPHTIVLTENDSIKTFGNNSDGQLGLGYTGGDEHTPQTVDQYNMGAVYADAGPDQFYCDGGSVQLGGEPGDYNNYMYQWQPLIGLDGGPIITSNPDTLAQPYSEISTQTFTTINYILWKTYRYGVLIDGCYETDTAEVTVRGSANAKFSSNAPVCFGEPINFINTGSSGNGLQYQWDFGAGATFPPGSDTLENPSGITYDAYGIKLVSLTITDTVCGSSDTYSDGITIYEQPTASFDYTPSANICANTHIDFTNTGSSGDNWSYTWDFGTDAVPSTSNAENPEGILYTTDGNKTVTLTISNGNCTENYSEVVTVDPTPVADFDHSASTYCTDNPIDFANTGTTGAVYEWDFGPDATPSTSPDENPTVTYASSGVKIIQLVTTIGACTDTVVKSISITETPDPDFTHNAPQCEGAMVDFTYTGTTGVDWTYFWDFGEGATPSMSSQQNPDGINYEGHGTKTIQLTVSNGICSSTTSQNININETPVADFTHMSTYCTTDSVNFENTGTTGADYAWDFGSDATIPSSTDENPEGVIYSSPGIKTVELITTLGSCTDTMVKTINITETPDPDFDHTAPQCEGGLVDFTYTGTTGTDWNYLWDFGDGATPSTSTQQNPLGVAYTSAGTKSVQLTVSNGMCSETTSQSFAINETPVADFTHISTYCTTDSVNFENTGTTGATYSWDFGSDATITSSTDENPEGVIYSSPGIKTVELITTLGSCTDTMVKTINITETPDPDFDHTAPQCEGGLVDFTYTGTTGTDWNYLWDFGEGAMPSTSTQQNPVGVFYTGAGTKTVQLTVSNGVCSETITQNITIEETPVADFTHISTYCTTDSVNFENTGTTGATYAWDFGSDATIPSSTDENPTGVVYSSPGIKTVELITTLGSCTDTMVKTINITETPDPDFTHTAPQCEGGLVDFTYTGTTGTDWNYLWDFGDGATPSTSTQVSPVGVEYDGYGTKTVQLTVTNGMCSETVTQNFDINQKPVADFTHMSTYCTTDSVNFENTGTTGADYEWDFGSDASIPSSTDENPEGIVYSSPGIKTVELITTLGSCTDTMVKTINIIETPDPNFTHNAPQCAGTAIDFSYPGTTGNDWNYLWDFGQGATPSISTQQNPESVKYSGGDKSVLLTVTNAQCSESIEQSISIHQLPDADAGVDTTICANTSVQIGSDSVTGYDYQWSDPNNSLDDINIANPTASPSASITTYHLLVTDSNGCQNQDSVTVVMMNSAFVDAGSDVEICYGDTVQIGMGLIEWQSYSWSPAAGLSDSTISNPLASPDSTTTYTVSVQYEQCEPITDDVKVLVHPLPDIEASGPNGEDTVEIARGESTTLIATGGTQYEWMPVYSLNSAGIYNPLATPDTSTLYTVTGIDVFGCENTDDVYVLVRIPGLYIPSAFTPNGDNRNDIFYVRCKGTKSFELNIMSRNGDLLYHSKNPDEGWDGTVQGTSEAVPSGAYVYHTKGEFSDGEKFNESGIINLIR